MCAELAFSHPRVGGGAHGVGGGQWSIKPTDIYLIISIKQCDGLHTGEELLQQIALVWRMDRITFKTEAHQERIDLKDALKVSKDRNRTASA